MDSLQTRDVVLLGDRRWQLHRLDRLGVDHLPFTLKVLLENLLRHEDGQLVTVEQVEAVRRWDPTAERRDEVDLHPTRVFLHDTNGVPALVDLAAMRDALAGLGGDPQAVNPLIPAEFVADHSVIADVFGRPDARDRNVELEYARNSERYRFLKWGQAALVLPYVLRSLLGSSN
jgi:aconitate hydratase